MKVGILTQHFYKNYGGILQNWALQQILLGMGHEPLTFEHDTCYTKRRWLMRMVKHIISERSLKRIPEYPYKGRIGHKPFIDFVLKHINSETVRLFTSDIEKKYGIDAFIVGSDQVWRPAFNSGRLYNMYLDFASDSVKKIAYAASFGVSRWEYSNNQTEKCRKLVHRFSALSVREDSAIALCQEHLGINAELVLDPTLLLDMKVYERICYNTPKKEPYVFVYALHLNDDIINLSNKKAEEQRTYVKTIQAGNKLKREDCIEDWLASFRDASCIVTDSFHGMVFSIIFNKPFLIIKNESGGNARYYSLLKQLGLENRIVDNINCLPEIDINWEIVNENRENLKELSIQFLKKALK